MVISLKEKSAARKKTRQQPESKIKSRAKEQFSFGPKDELWLNRKLQEYNQLIGKSVDAESIFVGKEKEWLAAMKIGRQSARDRFRAGTKLMEMQEKITDEIGYPFWPWLKAMGIPDKTAQRAIELTKFYKVERSLGDKTITECYAEIKAAKAKAKAKNDDDNSEVEDEQDDKQDTIEGEEENDIAGKLGKVSDNVSKTSPILPMHNDSNHGDGLDDDEELFGQEELKWNLDDIEEQLQGSINSLSGDLGPFPDPEKVVEQIDHCIELCEQLKVKVPVGQ